VILVILWMLLVQCLLWQAWVRERYAGAVDAVMAEFGLARHAGWRSGLLLKGLIDGRKVEISWKASPCAIRTRIKVKMGWRKRRWSDFPGVHPEIIMRKAREMLQRQ
jgi:hypothetical protein